MHPPPSRRFLALALALGATLAPAASVVGETKSSRTNDDSRDVPVAANPPAPRFKHHNLVLDGVEVEAVRVNLRHPALRVYTQFPLKGAEYPDSFANLVRGLPKEAVAINGAYFSEINWRVVGNFVEGYRLLNQSPSLKPGTTLSFDHQQVPAIERGLNLTIHYKVNDGKQWWEKPEINKFHGLNTPITGTSASSLLKLFNYYYAGGQVDIGNGGKAAVVEFGRVTRIAKGLVRIPVQGYVIAAIGSSAKKIDMLKKGDRITLEYRNARTGKPWRDLVKTAIGAGPLLLKKGKLDINPKVEGFTDPHVVAPSVRTGVGLQGKDALWVVVTHQGVSLEQFARIMKRLGCQDAVNLDGG